MPLTAVARENAVTSVESSTAFAAGPHSKHSGRRFQPLEGVRQSRRSHRLNAAQLVKTPPLSSAHSDPSRA
jgi:hypothetical protein